MSVPKKPVTKSAPDGTPGPEAARLEELLATSPSPFSDSVLQNAFHETPDVPEIHARARKACLDHVRAAREEGKTALQVVTGDAGDGKTHLVAWLRRQSVDGFRKGTATGRYALTVIPPLRSVSRVSHHVLQEVVRQLSTRLPGEVHVDDATDTPIEILIWRALLAIAKTIHDDRTSHPELRSRLEAVVTTNPDKFLSSCVNQLKEAWRTIGGAFVDTALKLPSLDLDREVFRVVARFPDGDEPERTAIVDWLGGASLPSERLDALGTALVLDDEAGATRGLHTLLALARLARTPIAIAFDQIEGTQRLGDDAMSAFLGTVAELYNAAPGTVLLVFSQSQIWPELKKNAPQFVQDRLNDSPVVHLHGLTPDEALALVATRMRHFWGSMEKGPADTLFPLTNERILFHVKRANLRTPRTVVRYFQALLRAPAASRDSFAGPHEVAPKELVRKKLAAFVEEARTSQPRAADARAALSQSVVTDLLVQAARTRRDVAGAKVEAVRSKRLSKTGISGVELVVRRGDTSKRVYIEGSNSQNGKSAASTLARFASVLEANGADHAVLLRDASLPLPPAARKALLELTPRGALLRVEEGEIVELSAIEALLNAAAAGDIGQNVDRKTALDLAVECGMAAALGLEQKLVEVVLAGESANAKGAEKAIAGEPTEASADAAPTSLDAVAVATNGAAILQHLRNVRAFDPAAHLARALGLSLEAVDAALRELEKKKLVDVVSDRNRAPVALLRPEALSP